MLTTETSNKLINRLLKVTMYAVLFGDLLFYMNSAYAAVSISTMLTNLASAHDQLMRLITAFGFVMGMFLMMKGVMSLRKFGESRSMMSQEFSLKGPLIYLFVGSALLYLPSSIQTGTATLFAESSPLAYVSATGDQWSGLLQSCFVILEIIGVVAFIRGLIILSHLGGGQGGHQASLGKAMAHIIGGILCINMYQFMQALSNTVNFGQ